MTLMAVSAVLLVISIATLVALAIGADVAWTVSTWPVGAVEWAAISLRRHRSGFKWWRYYGLRRRLRRMVRGPGSLCLELFHC